VGLFVAASALLAPLAFAGGGGVTVKSKPFPANANSLGSGTVKCPKDTQVTGGGSSYTPLSAGESSWRDNSTFPSGGRTWTAQIDNRSGTDHEAKAFVVCLKGEGLFRRSQSELVNGGISQYNATSVECPQGSRATGGGGYVSGLHSDMHILKSRPEGSRGWYLETFTAFDYTGSHEAYVVCDPKNSHDYATVVDITSVPQRSALRGTIQTVEAKAKCPQGAVATGGGYSWGTGELNVGVFNNRPKGERSWLFNARTYSPGIGFTAYARCLL
jgi:hypothetical protein